MSTRTFSGIVEVDNLPPHYGLSVTLAFFPVTSVDDSAPYNGDPPADSITDSAQLYNEVDLDVEIVHSKRMIPFSLSKQEGHYYIQLRMLLYQKQGDKVFAQAEQFFFGRRPLALLDDLPSVTLPVEWPSLALDELEHYGTVKPQKGS